MILNTLWWKFKGIRTKIQIFPVFTGLRDLILNFFFDNIKVLVNEFKGQEEQIFLAGDFNINSLDNS